MDELRSLKEEIRRAERNPNKTSSQRRRTYEKVIQFAKSTDGASKKLATEAIKDFFADFPEFQDTAINAVYDLCEDPDRDTRLAGYSALASLSQADRKWVVRNADVLVQLLQVDDEGEANFVKHALQQHIDLDATRTFKVLCDQCTIDPSNEHPEEAERLRELVINFLKERYRLCVSRAVKHEEVWNVLFKGLLEAIPQSSSVEVITIVRDILVHTPQFSISSYRDGATKVGNKVLDVLLDCAKVSLQLEIDSLSSSTKSKRSSIPKSCMLLGLAAYITTPLSYMPPFDGRKVPINSRTQKLDHPSTASADAFRLMQFYISLLGRDGLLKPKVLQNRLTKAAAVRIAWYVSRAWGGCEDMAKDLRKMAHCSKSDLQKARDDLVDVSPTLLSIVAHNSLRNASGGGRLRRAAHALVRACVDRERSTKEAWAAPDGFEESLQAVLAIVSNGASDDAKEGEGWDAVLDEYAGEEMETVSSPKLTLQVLKEIENLLRSLLEAKGAEEEQAVEGEEHRNVAMDIDVSNAPTTVTQEAISVPASKLAPIKTSLQEVNERRRDSERGRQNMNSPKPLPAREVPSERAASMSRANSLSVRGAASSTQVSKPAMSTTGDIEMDVRPSLSVTSNHAQMMSRGDLPSRPTKRAKSFTSEDNGNMAGTTVRPMNDAVSRTPSLLARLQSSDALNVIGGSASTGSLASRLLSPSLTSSKSVLESVSAATSEAQSSASRGHRSAPASSTSSMGFAIKGQADSVIKPAVGPQGYSEAPPTSSGVTEFKIRGAAQRAGDSDDSGGKLSLLDRIRDTSLAGEGESKSKKRKR